MREILRKRLLGYTLIELMIVVVIVLILSVVGGITLNSRLSVARVEESAKTLTSDLRYARSSAMFKNCPTRFIMCMDRDCTTTANSGRNVSKITGSHGNYIGTSSGPAQYYAILRLSQKEDSSGNCYNSTAVNALSSPTDSYNYWDFDRRPQSIPVGVVFTSIYTPNAVLDFGGDWSTSTHPSAANSLWFSSSSGAANVPVGTATASNGDPIAFQLSQSSCNPASEDCVGYLITIGAGGVTNMVKCSPGARATNATLSDTCF